MRSRMDARWMERFEGFGTDLLMSSRGLEACQAPLVQFDGVGESPSAIRDQLRDHVSRHAPKAPGVYGMIDAIGRLIYVGKSKMLRNRLLSYFLPGSKDEKAGRIVELARSMVWERQPSEFASLLREQTLIRRWQPTLNVVGMPNRRQSAYVCLGRGPAEQFYIARQFDGEASSCQGPFAGSGQLQRAIEILNRHFLLRDCSQKTTTHLTDQLSLFVIESRAGCLRAELGNCIAPCQVGASRAQYLHQEQLARAFLSGGPTDVLEKLECEMKKAAEGQHYERASRLCEDMRIMKWLSGKLVQHRKARESDPKIYLEWSAPAEQTGAPKSYPAGILYLLRQGGVEYAVPCPKNTREWNSIRNEIKEWLHADQQLATQFQRSTESLGLVATWFQRNPTFKQRLFSIRNADALPKTWSQVQDEWLVRPNAA